MELHNLYPSLRHYNAVAWTRFFLRYLINHGAIIGEATKIGTMSYVGVKAILGPNLNIPAGAHIPGGAIVNNQEDFEKIFSSETQKLQDHILALREKFRETIPHDFKP